MARGQSAHNPVEEHRNFVLWEQVPKIPIALVGIPKKINGAHNFYQVWIVNENVGFIPPLFFLALQSPPTTRENEMRIYLFGFGIGSAGSDVKLIE